MLGVEASGDVTAEPGVVTGDTGVSGVGVGADEPGRPAGVFEPERGRSPSFPVRSPSRSVRSVGFGAPAGVLAGTGHGLSVGAGAGLVGAVTRMLRVTVTGSVPSAVTVALSRRLDWSPAAIRIPGTVTAVSRRSSEQALPSQPSPWSWAGTEPVTLSLVLVAPPSSAPAPAPAP